MFHAGNPVGWTNLTESYWQQTSDWSRPIQLREKRKNNEDKKIERIQKGKRCQKKKKRADNFSGQASKKMVLALWLLLSCSLAFWVSTKKFSPPLISIQLT